MTLLTDELLTAAVEKSGVIPDFVEWDGNPATRITLRIEPHIGRYAECVLHSWMTFDGIVDTIKLTSQELDAQ